VPDEAHGGKPSRKYLKLTVDIGMEKRTIVSAIRALLDENEAIGQSVAVVCNTPRK
jgi:tRNA-binding EMAP/Myf-like protein